MVMTRCDENESCSKVLNFLERLDDRTGCTHEETFTVIKPREDVGGNRVWVASSVRNLRIELIRLSSK